MKGILKLKNRYLIPLIALCVLIILVFILSDEPFAALYYFFIGPFLNIHSFGNMLNAAVPLILGGLGIAIAMKAGHLNLGGEGQIYLGAFTAAAVSFLLSDFNAAAAVPAIAIAMAAGCLASGSMATLSGICKAFWKTNELITSFLLSLAVIPLVNYCVSGPFLDTETSLISTKKIPEDMRLTLILKPSNLNTGLFIALICVVLVYLFLTRTKKGYELRITGSNELFARYGGINTKANTILSMAISGAFYGLAGSVLVFGTYHSVIKEFSSGLGWNALAAALIANFNPVLIFPSAVFFAWIGTGARIAMQNTGLTSDVALIVQAVIIILATAEKLKKMRALHIKTEGNL